MAELRATLGYVHAGTSMANSKDHLRNILRGKYNTLHNKTQFITPRTFTIVYTTIIVFKKKIK